MLSLTVMLDHQWQNRGSPEQMMRPCVSQTSTDDAFKQPQTQTHSLAHTTRPDNYDWHEIDAAYSQTKLLVQHPAHRKHQPPSHHCLHKLLCEGRYCATHKQNINAYNITTSACGLVTLTTARLSALLRVRSWDVFHCVNIFKASRYLLFA